MGWDTEEISHEHPEGAQYLDRTVAAAATASFPASEQCTLVSLHSVHAPDLPSVKTMSILHLKLPVLACFLFQQ